MFRTAGVELTLAFGTRRIAVKIFRDRKLMATCTAQNGPGISLIHGPYLQFVAGDGCMAFETRKPFAAAFEFDGNDIEFAVPVDTASLRVDLNSIYLLAVNKSHNLTTKYTPLEKSDRVLRRMRFDKLDV